MEKIPCIPPIFHNNKYVTIFKESNFFCNQCSIIPNNSILPSKLKLLTEHTFISCDFSKTDILQIINSHDSNKTNGRMINIPILKLCGKAISRPLNIIFKTYLNKFSVAK